MFPAKFTQMNKFGGVFSGYSATFVGQGAWNKSYAPTAQAFINELKRNGWGNVSFSINKANLPYINNVYTFTVTVRDLTKDLQTYYRALQSYFTSYFNNLKFESGANTIPNTTTIYGQSYYQIEFSLSDNRLGTFAPAAYADVNFIHSTLQNKGWNIIAVSRVLPEKIRVAANVNNTFNTQQIKANLQRDMPYQGSVTSISNPATAQPYTPLQTGSTTINNNPVNLPNYNPNNLPNLPDNDTFKEAFKKFAESLGISVPIAATVGVIALLILIKLK